MDRSSSSFLGHLRTKATFPTSSSSFNGSNNLLRYASIHRKRETTMLKPIELDRTRSGCSWKSQEKWIKVCESLKSRWKLVGADGNKWETVRKLVEFGGSRWKATTIGGSIYGSSGKSIRRGCNFSYLPTQTSIDLYDLHLDFHEFCIDFDSYLLPSIPIYLHVCFHRLPLTSIPTSISRSTDSHLLANRLPLTTIDLNWLEV